MLRRIDASETGFLEKTEHYWNSFLFIVKNLIAGGSDPRSPLSRFIIQAENNFSSPAMKEQQQQQLLCTIIISRCRLWSQILLSESQWQLVELLYGGENLFHIHQQPLSKHLNAKTEPLSLCMLFLTSRTVNAAI